VTQLLDIFGFLSVLLRGLTLAFEALTVGGIVFSVIVAPPGVPPAKPLLRWIHVSSWLLGATQICAVAANSAILVGTTDLQFADVLGAEFWLAGIMVVAGALTIIVFSSTSLWRALCPIAALVIVIGSVMNSHSFARL